ncbi:Nucleolar protein 9 [Leucoagaricus sp. SymC.cos]|nr:Nucleolar protein 9 [Leucoagaricus sp. SymC.cos]
MPRGLRKRGRRNKKGLEEQNEAQEDSQAYEAAEDYTSKSDYDQTGNLEPSWIIPAASHNHVESLNPEAPYGFVDTEVKAYFRTVDVQIREWQETAVEVEGENGNIDADPNEERRHFFVAALTEMQGKEKQLATDPDCSIILERMAYSMDDFVRRVFMDSMAGSYESLVRHRFGSHVCQTFFALAMHTIQREIKGVYPQIPGSQDKGELRTMTQLVQDICEVNSSLSNSISALVMDPFGSHVIRSLLALLCPSLAKEDSSHSTLVRSKKSATWKAKQGPMKSVFDKDKGKGRSNYSRTPSEFRTIAKRFIEVVQNELDENEVRAMAANKVASPSLQMLLEVEADLGLSDEPGSLMDRVTVGVVSACKKGSSSSEPSDYLSTLLRDTTSSHLLETIFSRSPRDPFDVLWDLYLKGKLPRLAVHPIANFVIAKALERANEAQLSEACRELTGVWPKVIAASRSGVLRAVIERAARLQVLGEEAVEASCSAFGLEGKEQRPHLVFCSLTMLSFEDYNARKSAPTESKTESKTPNRTYGGPKHQSDGLEPRLQGSLLLQSLLQLPDPHSQIVTDSIASLSVEERIRLAQHRVSSRVYDALLCSSTIPSKAKRSFILGFIGHYHQLVDDRFGSRVVDRCWDFADTYLKEKIARSLIPHQQFLAGSFYSKFFSRNLNLYLLQRRPEEWRALQAEKRKKPTAEIDKTSALPTGKASAMAAQPSQPSITEPAPSHPKRKRKRQEDEIDALFSASLGKKIKKGALAGGATVPDAEKDLAGGPVTVDKGLQDVLGAIKAAPMHEKVKAKRSRGS